MTQNLELTTVQVGTFRVMWQDCQYCTEIRHRLAVIRKICIYFFTCLLCASLLLKMNLGINFWIIGSSPTFRLCRSYESKKVSLMHRPMIYRCASKEALQ